MEAKKMASRTLILMIDDEQDFIEPIKFFLENLDFEVIAENSGEAGIKTAAERSPDLILLDLLMPGMNGHEACRLLKENDATRDIPIIMFTSQKNTIDKVQALNLGTVDYMSKDFPLEEILARINAGLKRAPSKSDHQFESERNKKILELRKIIDDRNIRIVYQPIVALSDRSPIGYEALTRGPKNTPLESPVSLFTLADETNMFFDLDSLCRKTSVEKAEFLKKDQTLFLNTDPSVMNTQLFKTLDFLDSSGLDPSQVCLEITERTCIKSFSQLISQIKDFRSQGVRIAIDDVGTGYSNLKAIAELQPEFVKVDISLVKNVDSDSVKKGIVEAIAVLAKGLNSSLIAEGIETENEYRTLISLGIEYGQGFFLGRPSENPV